MIDPKKKGKQVRTIEEVIACYQKRGTMLRCAGEVCAQAPAALLVRNSLAHVHKLIADGKLYHYDK